MWIAADLVIDPVGACAAIGDQHLVGRLHGRLEGGKERIGASCGDLARRIEAMLHPQETGEIAEGRRAAQCVGKSGDAVIFILVAANRNRSR